MSDRILVKNVRLSFPNIFQRSVFQGEEGKFQATFLIPKGDPQIKKLVDIIKGKIANEKIKVPVANICLKDGDSSDYDGYEDHFALKASSQYRPTVINQHKIPVAEEDGIVYAGCWVNGIVDFWVQNNKWGKRVNCNLHGVQFVKDDSAFGNVRVDVTEEFEETTQEPDTNAGNDLDLFGAGGEEQIPAKKERAKAKKNPPHDEDNIWD